MRSRKIVAALCALAATAGLSACGSDDESTASTTTAAPSGAAASPGKTPEGEPIVLGTVCSCSGAQAAALGKVDEVAQAWEKAVNAKGGINGHPVKLIVKDDGGVPAKSLAAVKELVEQDEVMAIVGQASLADAAWEKYVASKGVPVVGGITVESPYLTNPDFFISGTSQPIAVLGQMALAKKAGAKTFGVLYCAESPACAQLDPLAKAAAQLNGLKYASAKVSATAPNYTAQCLAMKNAGVDALQVAHNSTVVLRVVDGCASQGYKPRTIGQTTTSAPDWLKNENMEGALLTTPGAPYTDESIPAVKEFLDAVETYSPGTRESPQFSYDAIFPWTGGKLFEAAAKQAKITPTSTGEDVKKGLYALKDETLGGLTGPLNYTKGKVSFPSCYFVTGVEGGKFTSPEGREPVCVPEAQAQAILKGLSR